MRKLKICFLDSTEITIIDTMIDNYNELKKWLVNNNDLPFIAKSKGNPIRIIYKDAIKWVEIFE